MARSYVKCIIPIVDSPHRGCCRRLIGIVSWVCRHIVVVVSSTISSGRAWKMHRGLWSGTQTLIASENQEHKKSGKIAGRTVTYINKRWMMLWCCSPVGYAGYAWRTAAIHHFVDFFAFSEVGIGSLCNMQYPSTTFICPHTQTLAHSERTRVARQPAYERTTSTNTHLIFILFVFKPVIYVRWRWLLVCLRTNWTIAHWIYFRLPKIQKPNPYRSLGTFPFLFRQKNEKNKPKPIPIHNDIYMQTAVGSQCRICLFFPFFPLFMPIPNKYVQQLRTESCTMCMRQSSAHTITCRAINGKRLQHGTNRL